jgi:hypothetical protein
MESTREDWVFDIQQLDRTFHENVNGISRKSRPFLSGLVAEVSGGTGETFS